MPRVYVPRSRPSSAVIMIGSFPLGSLRAMTVEYTEAPEGARGVLTAQGYYEVRRE